MTRRQRLTPRGEIGRIKRQLLELVDDLDDLDDYGLGRDGAVLIDAAVEQIRRAVEALEEAAEQINN